MAKKNPVSLIVQSFWLYPGHLTIAFCITFILMMMIGAGNVLAHKFFITAWPEGDTVFLEAAFGDGSLANNAEVIVMDEAGTILLEDRTSEQGEFSFTIPSRTALKIRVKAGMGHEDEVLIPLEEIEAALGENPVSEIAAVPSVGTVPAAKAVVTESATAALTAAELEQIIERVMDKKLRPIVKKMAQEEREESSKFTQILAGIGYIIGFVGAGTYFHYRRRIHEIQLGKARTDHTAEGRGDAQ